MTEKERSSIDISLQLPFRFSKPREQGISIIDDRGIPLSLVESIFQSSSSYIDLGKLSSGAAYLDSGIRDKVALYKHYEIDPYFSGTLFEKFYKQDNVLGYAKFLESMGLETVEIADSAVNIPLERRLEIISQFAKDFRVIGRVGAKDTDSIISPSEWVAQMKAYIEAGCQLVIAEGRGGISGLYRPNGEIRKGLVADIVKGLDETKVVFGAPTRAAQSYFVKLLGANANLGNVSAIEILSLESLRNGLSCETLFVE